MLRQMERSAVQVLAKRGLSQRQIAKQLGHSRVTIARALREPVDKQPAKRRRASIVDPHRPQIEGWLKQGLSIVRMVELARADPARPYAGSRAVFGDHVRRIRLELERAEADVPVRFEGLPAEYPRSTGARSPASRSPSAPRASATSWPASSSTAGGSGCASAAGRLLSHVRLPPSGPPLSIKPKIEKDFHGNGGRDREWQWFAYTCVGA
jgi:hypothetical protein